MKRTRKNYKNFKNTKINSTRKLGGGKFKNSKFFDLGKTLLGFLVKEQSSIPFAGQPRDNALIEQETTRSLKSAICKFHKAQQHANLPPGIQGAQCAVGVNDSSNFPNYSNLDASFKNILNILANGLLGIENKTYIDDINNIIYKNHIFKNYVLPRFDKKIQLALDYSLIRTKRIIRLTLGSDPNSWSLQALGQFSQLELLASRGVQGFKNLIRPRSPSSVTTSTLHPTKPHSPTDQIDGSGLDSAGQAYDKKLQETSGKIALRNLYDTFADTILNHMDIYLQKPLKIIKWISITTALDFGLSTNIANFLITESVNHNQRFFNKIKPIFKFYIILMFEYASELGNYETLNTFIKNTEDPKSTIPEPTKNELPQALGFVVESDDESSSPANAIDESEVTELAKVGSQLLDTKVRLLADVNGVPTDKLISGWKARRDRGTKGFTNLFSRKDPQSDSFVKPDINPNLVAAAGIAPQGAAADATAYAFRQGGSRTRKRKRARKQFKIKTLKKNSKKKHRTRKK